jgi:rhamnogalacturonyl hydrolase YesR
MLDFYNATKKEKYLDAFYTLAQGKWDDWNEKIDPETGILKSARFWSDDMYNMPTNETRIYKINKDPNTHERVARWLTVYLDSLQLPNGLIRHTTEVPFLWGRGVGWPAVGLANALKGIPDDHPKWDEMMEGYLKLMEGLIPYQSSNGLWRQLIDYEEAYEETSATGMIAYAMVTGLHNGWLDPEVYVPVVEKAWMGLVDLLDEHGELGAVCVGTNQKFTAQEYLDRPARRGNFHGQAPLLWTAEALYLLGNETEETPD